MIDGASSSVDRLHSGETTPEAQTMMLIGFGANALAKAIDELPADVARARGITAVRGKGILVLKHDEESSQHARIRIRHSDSSEEFNPDFPFAATMTYDASGDRPTGAYIEGVKGDDVAHVEGWTDNRDMGSDEIYAGVSALMAGFATAAGLQEPLVPGTQTTLPAGVPSSIPMQANE
ncbi:MAG TPA: hypothetical protein VGM08_00625 [Candidatus Saccharimonadales bacterium]|jgi:hypothetical protein